MDLQFAGGIDVAAERAVLGHYDLSALVTSEPAGGTANPKTALVTGRGRFLLRRRRPEFSATEIVEYDHSLLQHLGARGLPVPQIVPAVDGRTWVEHGGAVFEVHSWIDCEPFRQHRKEQVAAAGETLGRLHRATQDFVPRGSKSWPREDHPESLVAQLEPHLARATGEHLRTGKLIRSELTELLAKLPDAAYESLPHLIVHGDYHPGNVKFRGDAVVGLFDFDWSNRQSRLLDVRDGLYCFGFRRPADLDPDDIWSLTQPAAPNVEFSRAFFSGYGQHVELTAAEREALPLLLRSRLCQMRIRGARKVAEGDKLRFLTWGIEEQVRWVGREWERFAEALVGGGP